MLSNTDMIATIAVKDIEVAKKFYGETLGLKQVSQNQGGVLYASGSSKCFVYVSDYAGTNQATTATWSTDEDIETLVNDLKSKGITFEHYDFPFAKLEGDIHIMGEGEDQGKAAWFKDPDGNILNISSGMDGL